METKRCCQVVGCTEASAPGRTSAHFACVVRLCTAHADRFDAEAFPRFRAWAGTTKELLLEVRRWLVQAGLADVAEDEHARRRAELERLRAGRQAAERVTEEKRAVALAAARAHFKAAGEHLRGGAASAAVSTVDSSAAGGDGRLEAVRAQMRELREQRQRHPPARARSAPPRYDACFAAGTAWLDSH
jgi:hypothetical protein